MSVTEVRRAATLLLLLIAAVSASVAKQAKQAAFDTSGLEAHSQESRLPIFISQPASSRRLVLFLRSLHQDTNGNQQQQSSDSTPLATAITDPQLPTSNPASPLNPLSTTNDVINPTPAPVISTPADNPPSPPTVPESPSGPTPGPTPAPAAAPQPAPVIASPTEEAPQVPEMQPPASPAASRSITPAATPTSTVTKDPQSGNAVNQSWANMSQQNASDNQTVIANSTRWATDIIDDSSPALPNMVYVIMTLRGVTPDAFKATYHGNVIEIVSQVAGVPKDLWNSTLQQHQQQQQQQLLMSHTQLAGRSTGNRRLLRQRRVGDMLYDTGRHRRLLQTSIDQQGLQVTLSAYTSNPQLAVNRLTQPPVLFEASMTTTPVGTAMPAPATTSSNSGSSNFTGCTLELCSRLLAAGVPLDNNSLEVWPKYSFFSSGTSSGIAGSRVGVVASDPGREYQLAYARQLAIIIVASVAGFVVLLVLALNCGKLINCCVSCMFDDQTETLDSKVVLPVAQPIGHKPPDGLDGGTKHKQLVYSKSSRMIKSAVNHPLNHHSEGSASTASCSSVTDPAKDEVESSDVLWDMSGEVADAATPGFSNTQWTDFAASPTHRVDHQRL